VAVRSLVHARMPADAAAVVEQALERMTEQGLITRPWQALEWWAADYLAGPDYLAGA